MAERVDDGSAAEGPQGKAGHPLLVSSQGDAGHPLLVSPQGDAGHPPSVSSQAEAGAPLSEGRREAWEEADSEGTPQGRRLVELLWDPPAPSSRGPSRRISLDELVEAAIALADASGFEALSMRSLARGLGVGAMTLYTYVPGKSELFELMIDRAYGERPLPASDLPWRRRYEEHAIAALAMYRRHPWLVHSNLWRLPPGPHVLDISEDLLAVGRAAGLATDVGARVSGLLESYVFGIARGEIADQAQAARTGESVDEYWGARGSVWTTYFDPERYPMLFATWQTGYYDEGAGEREELRFALDLILDSVERLVSGAPGQAGADDIHVT